MPLQNIIVLAFLLQFFVIKGNSVPCQYNIKCYIGCFNQTCQYDPQTNSFYNSSITDLTTGYHGPGCCIGCNQDYYYFPANNTCYQGDCKKIINQLLLYWSASNNKCNQTCPSTELKIPSLGRCSKNCPSNMVLDIVSQSCLTKCPEKSYLSPSAKACYPNNCKNAIEPFSDELTMRCVTINDCSFDQIQNLQTYADNSTLSCKQKCSDNTYAHPVTKICVKNCYSPFSFKNLIINQCVQVKQDTPLVRITTLGSQDKDIAILKQRVAQLQTQLTITIIVASLVIFSMIITYLIIQCYFKKVQKQESKLWNDSKDNIAFKE